MDRPQFLSCPHCGGLVINYKKVQPITDQQVTITQECESCGHEWEDTFWVERSTNLEDDNA